MKKQCTKCLKKLPATINYFHKRTNGLRSICIECHKHRCKIYYEDNLDKFIEYQSKNRDKILKRKKQYRQKNKKKIAAYKYKYHKHRYHNDIQYKLLHNCGNHIRKYLKRHKDSQRSVELLGCSINELKKHLESKFDHNMSWENYGSYWHIDHIVPCSSFDFSQKIEQQKCFHYSNLQPLEAKENIRKSNKL